MNPPAPASTRLRSRTLGAVYLLYFLAAVPSLVLVQGLLVANDAAGTANNILAHESLYRAGLALDLVGNALYIVVTALLYRLLAPAGRNMALVAAFLALVGSAVQIFGNVFRMAVLLVLQDNAWLGSFNGLQLHAAALLGLKLHAQVFASSFVLFGVFDILVGCLVVRSAVLPRALGVPMILAGAGLLTFLWPPLGAVLSSGVLPLAFLAEFVLMLWLLVRGVDGSAGMRDA